MNLVVLVYDLTKTFPKEETYGLSSQMRRAAVSVPSNIAEGAADRSHEQFKNFVGIALGSLNELNTQLEIAYRVGYLSQDIYTKSQELVDECMRTTYGLKRNIEQKIT